MGPSFPASHRLRDGVSPSNLRLRHQLALLDQVDGQTAPRDVVHHELSIVARIAPESAASPGLRHGFAGRDDNVRIPKGAAPGLHAVRGIGGRRDGVHGIGHTNARGIATHTAGRRLRPGGDLNGDCGRGGDGGGQAHRGGQNATRGQDVDNGRTGRLPQTLVYLEHCDALRIGQLADILQGDVRDVAAVDNAAAKTLV